MTSAVTRTPRALAWRITSTLPAVRDVTDVEACSDVCGEQHVPRDHRLFRNRRPAGQAEPRAHLTLVHLGAFGEPWFFGVLGDDVFEGLDVLQSAPPSSSGSCTQWASSGEDAYLGGRVGHRAEFGEAQI